VITGIDPILDGDSGSPMGFLLYGDVDALDVELFMGDEELTDSFPDGTDFDVVECYVRKVPARDEYGEHGLMTYHYTDQPGRGARKCTRIEQNTVWGHWCMNHIYEPAQVGIPVANVLDPIWPMVSVRILSPEARAERKHWRGPLDGEAYVYLCRDCARAFHAREDAARAERLAAYRAQQATKVAS
jgi:hypothetical protein